LFENNAAHLIDLVIEGMAMPTDVGTIQSAETASDISKLRVMVD